VAVFSKLRYRNELSDEETAQKLRFDSVEEMRTQLKNWDIPTWLVGGEAAVTSRSTARKKSYGERRARSSGPPKELPPARNAMPLFREVLEALMRANEELEHRKESRQGRHYPYRTVSRKTPSDDEWDSFAELLGLDSVAKENLYFGGGTINRGTSSPAPRSPLPELIGTYLLAGGAVEPLVEALHEDPDSANWSEIRKRIEGRKSGPEKVDGIKAVASQLAILVRGGTLSRGNPPPGRPGHELNLSHRIAIRREAGVPDKQIYEDLLVALGLSEQELSWDEFRRLADLGLKLP